MRPGLTIAAFTDHVLILIRTVALTSAEAAHLINWMLMLNYCIKIINQAQTPRYCLIGSESSSVSSFVSKLSYISHVNTAASLLAFLMNRQPPNVTVSWLRSFPSIFHQHFGVRWSDDMTAHSGFYVLLVRQFINVNPPLQGLFHCGYRSCSWW